MASDEYREGQAVAAHDGSEMMIESGQPVGCMPPSGDTCISYIRTTRKRYTDTHSRDVHAHTQHAAHLKVRL